MKKFLVLLVLVGGVAAAVFFYDPYLKPYLEPLVEKVAGKSPETTDPEPEAPEPEAPEPPTVAETDSSPQVTTPERAQPAAPQKSEIDLIVEERYPMPEFIPLTTIVDNWNNIPERAMPAEVSIQDQVPFQLRDAGGKVIGASVAPPGTLVKPVRVQGSTLTVASLANASMQSQVALDKTDLKSRIEKRYNEFILGYSNRIKEQREKAKKALLAKPETLAAIKESQGGGGNFDKTEDPRFGVVKASIAKGDVTGFELGEAVGFRWNGSERINGPVHKGTYDTVTVKYEARTIFGVFPGEAKCLLQGGRVVGWVDPITEEDLG